MLAGAWLSSPPILEISDRELAQVTPALLQTGAAALGWRKVQHSSLRTSRAALELQQAYRLHAIQAALHEREIQEVFNLLRSHGIEPVLVKGWAIARLYVEPGLRPYGDIDLCVDPDQFCKAKALLQAGLGQGYRVDLHRGFVRFGHQSWNELYSRSRCHDLDGVPVRTLAPEDDLRLICFHFLREGAWRPLWLCDVAVSLAARSESFDWNLCLGSDLKSRNWVAHGIALAKHLLDANVSAVPAMAVAKQMPAWFLPAVLKEWEVCSMHERHKSPLNSAWRRPVKSLRGLPRHWPSPIEATISLNGRIDESPRLPYQIGNCFVRAMNFLWPPPWTAVRY